MADLPLDARLSDALLEIGVGLLFHVVCRRDNKDPYGSMSRAPLVRKASIQGLQERSIAAPGQKGS